MKKLKLIIFLTILCASSHAQYGGYKYARELNGGNGVWRKIALPADIYSKARANLSDIRIINVDEKGDTTEVPFLINFEKTKPLATGQLPIINRSSAGNIWYYTLQVSDSVPIDKISLSFHEKNFDWKVQLQGSMDQRQWFDVLKDYRIMSISKPGIAAYSFTDLYLSATNFKYYRMAINSATDPQLSAAQLPASSAAKRSFMLPVEGLKYIVSSDEKKEKTFIEISLPMPLPLAALKLQPADSFDFYRPISVYSSKNKFEEARVLDQIYTGTYGSWDTAAFLFPQTLARYWRIEIQNDKNVPLSFAGLQARYQQYELTARFTKPGKNLLLYGGKLEAPQYDIEHFKEKIPDNLELMQLGSEQNLSAPNSKESKSFFDKWMLWAILIVSVGGLGFFAMKMFRER